MGWWNFVQSSHKIAVYGKTSMDRTLHIVYAGDAESSLFWSHSIIASNCGIRSQVVQSTSTIVSLSNDPGTMVATTLVDTTQWTPAYQSSSAKSLLLRRATMHPTILVQETGLTDVLNCKTLQSWWESQLFKWWSVSRRRTWQNQPIDIFSTVDLGLGSPSPCPIWPILATLTAG